MNELTTTAEKINQLISEYDFPLEVLQDVNHRLECNQEEHYQLQQLSYLENLINYGIVKRRESHAANL